MKTVTITQEMVEGLESAESKKKFVNTLKSMFKIPELEKSSFTAKEVLSGLVFGLTDLNIKRCDYPKRLNGLEAERYRIVQAGYVPVDIDCDYSEYKYRCLDCMSDDEIKSFMVKLNKTSFHNKVNSPFMKFVNHMSEVCTGYCVQTKRNCWLDFQDYLPWP